MSNALSIHLYLFVTSYLLSCIFISPLNAATCFLPDCQKKLEEYQGNGNQDGQYCLEEGYVRYDTGSCPPYSSQQICPYNARYLKCDQQKWCRDNGYTVDNCTLPTYLTDQCPNGLELYQQCQTDYKKACKIENPSFTDSCLEGWQIDPNQVCSFTPLFGTCCNLCNGFDYLAGSIPVGYIARESCSACGELTKYKAVINPCDGYQSCSNGGKVGTKTCLHGNETRYRECCSECSDYPFSENAIPAGYIKGESCDSCWGLRYKANANPCDGYQICPIGEGVSASGTCLSGFITKYKSCCPNTCSRDTCPSGTICTKEACSGKYCATGCQINYIEFCHEPITNCTTLGYNSSSCSGHQLACPYDTSKLFCL